jgi:hypothetical protein
MKKEYLKPTAKSHELRCRSMVAQSVYMSRSSLQMGNRGGGYDYDSDSESDSYSSSYSGWIPDCAE